MIVYNISKWIMITKIDLEVFIFRRLVHKPSEKKLTFLYLLLGPSYSVTEIWLPPRTNCTVQCCPEVLSVNHNLII